METRAWQRIEVRSEGGVATLAMNNPGRKNAIGPTMMNELLWAIQDAHDDASIRSIVLTGKGDAFCSGGDFAEITSGTGDSSLPNKGDFVDLLLAIVKAKKPVIARVNGIAMGGGIGLTAACHFAIAADTAVFGTPEIKVGLFPFMILAVLARVVPRRKLTEMMLLGDKLTATAAQQAGVVGKVVPAAELDAAVAELTTKIGTTSPLTMQLGLDAYATQESLDLAEALPMLRERLAQCLSTADAMEGLRAFLEKRPPVWTGR